MRALEFHGPRDLRLVSRPELTIPVGQQVLFRPTLAGICGTDRAIYLGHYDCTPPRVLGHEAVGVVEAVGDDVEGLRPRDRVILDPTQSCGACRRCVRGETSHCVNKGPLEIGVGRDGAFRQGMLIEARALHRLRDDMSDRHAVLIEPLACVLNALDKSGAAAGDRVTVIGGGPMGVLAAQVAQRRSAMVEVVEIDPYRQGPPGTSSGCQHHRQARRSRRGAKRHAGRRHDGNPVCRGHRIRGRWRKGLPHRVQHRRRHQHPLIRSDGPVCQSHREL